MLEEVNKSKGSNRSNCLGGNMNETSRINKTSRTDARDEQRGQGRIRSLKGVNMLNMFKGVNGVTQQHRRDADAQDGHTRWTHETNNVDRR